MTSSEAGNEQKLKKAEILIENFRTALRVGERYLFISLATAAVAVVGKEGVSKTVDLFIIHLDIQTTLVTVAALAVSWCTAWLCWIYVRHAVRLAQMVAAIDVEVHYDTALAALTYPSLFTVRGALLRWLIIIAMGSLIFGSVMDILFRPNLFWIFMPFFLILELPFVILLFSSCVQFRETKQNALLAFLPSLRPNQQSGK